MFSKSFKTLGIIPWKNSDFTWAKHVVSPAHNISITGVYSVCLYIHTQSNNDHGIHYLS